MDPMTGRTEVADITSRAVIELTSAQVYMQIPAGRSSFCDGSIGGARWDEGSGVGGRDRLSMCTTLLETAGFMQAAESR